MNWKIPAALVGCLVVSVGCDPNKKTSPSASILPPPAPIAAATPIAPAPAAQYSPPPVQQPVVYDAPQQAQPAFPAAEPADVAEPASEIAMADASEPAPEPMLSRGTPIHHRVISSSHSMHYTIKKGDSLWSIAQAHYGNGNKWKLIARANPKIDPNRIFVGSKIMLP